MRFIEIISKKKILLISILLSTYILFNLLEGERGLISYFEKQKIKKLLTNDKEKLTHELKVVNNKNSFLSDNIDLDYLEILYREKFMVGKTNEKIYLKQRNHFGDIKIRLEKCNEEFLELKEELGLIEETTSKISED